MERGLTSKGGVFLNDALGLKLDFTDDDDNDADLRLRENQLSFIGEFKMQGRFHVTPNVSLRAAYELMFITSVAMAPSQATFIPEFAYLNTTGDPFITVLRSVSKVTGNLDCCWLPLPRRRTVSTIGYQMHSICFALFAVHCVLVHAESSTCLNAIFCC